MIRNTQTFSRGIAVAVAATSLSVWLADSQVGYAKAKTLRRSRQVASATVSAETGERESVEQTIEEAIDFARDSHTRLGDVKDYTAVFTKTERVGNNVIEQSMDIKFRREPFSVYLHYRSGKEAGREVIYVDGANGGCLVVHEQGLLGSLAGTQKIKLDDATVKAENRYPITEIGIAKIIEKSLSIWQAEQKADPKGAEVHFVSNISLNATPCDIIEVDHGRQSGKSEFTRSRVFFDHESRLPIRVERFGRIDGKAGKPELLEMYDYRDLKANVGLTDADFDPKNPKYGF